MDVQQALWWFSTIAECAAFVALVVRGLAGSYRWFAAYLAFGVARGLALHFVAAPSTTAYAIAWMSTTPLTLALLVAATFEIVTKIPSHYRGFGSFGRQKLRRLLQAALAFALISSVLEASGPQWTFSVRDLLAFLIALNRITTTTLAVYLVLVAVFISKAPAELRRNLTAHIRLLASYLALQSCVTLWLNVFAGGHGTATANVILTGGSVVFFALWCLLLTRRGEEVRAKSVLAPEMIAANEDRERALRDAARRFSDG